MSSLALKVIAIVTMTIDHIGAVLRHLPNYGDLSFSMRVVGRVAFPLFCFLIAEGMRKSKNRARYVLWLLAFAFISLIPYSLFNNVHLRGLHVPPAFLDFSRNNVLFTLFLGAGAIFVFDFVRKLGKGKASGIILHMAGLLAPAAAAFIANYLSSDYSHRGVLVIFATYWVMSFEMPEQVMRFARAVPLLVWCHIEYSNGLLPEWVPLIGEGLQPRAVFAAVSVFLILLYDGTPGQARFRGSAKIWFYIYYPAHLLAVSGFAMILRANL